MNENDTTGLVFDLSAELIRTACASEYGQIRDDMTEDILMKRVYGTSMTDNKRAEILARTLHMVLSTVQVLSDTVEHAERR